MNHDLSLSFQSLKASFLTTRLILQCRGRDNFQFTNLFMKQLDFDSRIINITSSIAAKNSFFMWKKFVLIILILHVDNSSISCSLATKYSLLTEEKKCVFLERYYLANWVVLIPNDFPQNDNKGNRLYKSFYFFIWYDPFIHEAASFIKLN